MELVTSDPVVSSVSRFSTNRILQLKQLLEFVSSKDQFKWKGNAEELAELISLILETDERPQLSEDPAHNLLSFKILNIIVKWWKKTLTIAIQGKEHRMFKDKRPHPLRQDMTMAPSRKSKPKNNMQMSRKRC